MNKLPILFPLIIALFTLPAESSEANNTIYLPIVSNEVTKQPPPLGEVSILNDFAYVSSTGSLHIVGEVFNGTSKTLRFVKITANLYDKNGMLLDVDFTFSLLDNIPPSEKTCFDVIFLEPAGWSYYEFEQVAYYEDGIPVTGLTAFNVSGSYDPTFGWYEILGEIRNDNSYTVNYVSPIATLYNSAGNVVGCDFSFVSSTHLAPGQKSSFDVTSLGRDYSDVTNFRIQIDGDPVNR